MKFIMRLFSWNKCLLTSIGVLLILIVFNFYGLYSNKFYLLKPDNYIFPLLTIIHFLYLYVMWFKIKEQEGADPQMRNLEFAMYAILVIYLFKILDTVIILKTYTDYESHIIPGTFIPIGLMILTLQLLLLLCTYLAFRFRKEMIGDYKFDNINENIDSWQ